MSNLSQFLGGGTGGSEVNSIARFYKDQDTTTFTDSSGAVWLRSGTILTSGLSNYPDAYSYSDIRSATQNGEKEISHSTTHYVDSGFLREDGLKFYLTTSDASVAEYSLSTAGDVDTMSLTRTSNVFRIQTISAGLNFRDNGTRLFYPYNNTVTQQDLSTAWDVSTLSSTKQTMAAVTAADLDIWGNYVFVIAIGSPTLYSYYLTTSWDVTTLNTSLNKNVNIKTKAGARFADLFNSLNSININSSGTLMYIGSTGTGSFSGYTCMSIWEFGTAFDIDTISFTNTYRISKDDTVPIYTAGFAMNKSLNKAIGAKSISSHPNYIVKFASYTFPTAIGISNVESVNDFLRIK